MSVPPELLQQLGMSGPPDMGGGMGADQPPDDSAGGGPEDEPIRLLKEAFERMHRYQAVEPDEEDTAEAAKIAAAIQKMLAKDQADLQAALGNPATHRIMRKAAAGNAAGY